MKTKNQKTLPKTPEEIDNGGVYHQAVRCGKRPCRCMGGQLHEGFHYFIQRVNGRQQKTYIPRAQVTQIRTLVEDARRIRRNERRELKQSRTLLRNLRSRLREFRSILSGPVPAGQAYE
jgi:hypothetical protein